MNNDDAEWLKPFVELAQGYANQAKGAARGRVVAGMGDVIITFPCGRSLAVGVRRAMDLGEFATMVDAGMQSAGEAELATERP